MIIAWALHREGMSLASSLYTYTSIHSFIHIINDRHTGFVQEGDAPVGPRWGGQHNQGLAIQRPETDLLVGFQMYILYTCVSFMVAFFPPAPPMKR